MKFLQQKKGISPLVATILLIAFSVLLGAVVMSWGESYIEEKAEFVTGVEEISTGCDAIQLGVLTLQGVPQVCGRGNMIEIWLDNGPNVDIWDVHTRLVGTTTAVVQESTLFGPIIKGNAQKIEVPAGSVGQIQQLKLSPKIKPRNEVVFCPDKALIIENIPPCSP